MWATIGLFVIAFICFCSVSEAHDNLKRDGYSRFLVYWIAVFATAGGVFLGWAVLSLLYYLSSAEA